MERSLTTLSQLGLGNAAVLTVHYIPAVRGIMEDMLVEIVEEPLRHHYLDLIEDVEKINEEDPEPLKSLGVVLTTIAGESRSREEFKYLVHTQMRVYRLWGEMNSENRDTDENVEAGIYISAAQHIVQQRTLKWAKDSKTRLPAVDTTELLKNTIESLKDGSYFSDEMYDRPLKMSETGALLFAGDSKEENNEADEEWADEIS